MAFFHPVIGANGATPIPTGKNKKSPKNDHKEPTKKFVWNPKLAVKKKASSNKRVCTGPYLIFTLSKELLLAEVINSEQFSDSHQDSSLEWCYGQRNILHWGLSIDM